MPPLVLADFIGVINIAHRFNHKPDVRTPSRVILHENLRKVKRDECLRLTRLITIKAACSSSKHDDQNDNYK